MTQDVIFRSAALGGFNKEDVLEYISEQKEVIASLEKKTAELEEKYNRCDKDRADAVSERAAAGDELNSVLSKIDELTAAISQKDERILSLTDELSKMSGVSEELEICRAKLEEAQKTESKQGTICSEEIMNQIAVKDAIIDELKRKTESLYTEVEKLKAESEQKGSFALSAETTVGNAILDARRFSDTIIKEAEDKVAEISDKARFASDATRSRVDGITDGIKAFAEKFNSVMSEIYADASSLECDMNVFNDYFNKAKQEIDSYVSPIDKDSDNA
ncbi:MAG: hypothetical protein PUG93_08200 [Oscillospiraceae bacterium]|nr:hypothetical protein [Oscillospiraceae bacterium]MDD7355096.1 hypothetical protein [Oscillospiraceae bacterium]MDY3937779.1 hypothetical protein [Oscillospiraceae bacterium]